MATRKTKVEKVTTGSLIPSGIMHRTSTVLDAPERFKLSESGMIGLPIFSGVSTDELKREVQFPMSIQTYKQMSYHSTINASLTLFDNIISKATWAFKPPKDATEEEIKQCEIVDSMMRDMDHTWGEFIHDVLSMNIFGFSVHEKVYRRRYTSNGSMYNDGIIAWKKLPIRAQESIEKFVFSPDGNEVIGVKQNLTSINDPYGRYSGRTTNEIVIPRSKFMLFRAGKHRGDPYGKSPLRDAYLAWKFIVSLEELEATGVSKDLVGLPVLYLPPQYLSSNASPEQAEIRRYYENAMRNLQMNNQSAMILPNAFDPDSKQSLFKLDLLSVDGKKNFDITSIKEYYKNLIMISLASDILTMGQTQVGSFALGSIKNSLAGSVAEAMITSISEVIDRELIKQTYELNGWDVSRRGYMDYDNLSDVDLESVSKAFQRYASTGLLELDRDVLNAVRVSLGIDGLPQDLEPQTDILTGNTSKSGEGFKTAGEGTATNPSGDDTSSSNLENVG